MTQQLSWLWGLVVRPRPTIRDIVERGTLRVAVVMVLVFSVLLGLLTLVDAAMPVTAGMESAAGPYGAQVMEATRWLVLALAVLMPVLVLLNILVGRAIVHVLARAFQGSGQYWDLFKTQCYLYPLGVLAMAPLYLLRVGVGLFSTDLAAFLNLLLMPLLMVILIWLVVLDVLMVRQVYGVSTARAGGIAGLGYVLIFAFMCLCTCAMSVGLALMVYTG
ncbi:MAG: YIP1 family protein [Chloroflexi bacterium]|nr:YIP1 family protein [Chloroflexota bacterium]MBU1750172.1 YIP1 family protein [Chloroflexota bacterium]MBU1879433.1 YIP1 family protein [Chloroflexota bacterium]